MKKPKVLVIMPAYNAARFLHESIPSILNQKDSFRINVRSHVFVNYLKKGE